MAQSLDVFSFPLHGERLIEASAGTGKTYTIAGLYLRLLLGHGANGTAHNAPLLVENILVVTFTEAATGELRDRIRQHIYDARRAFERGEATEGDEITAQLLLDIPVEQHKQAAQTLLNAERQMDEASIYTIHSFCQRMLKQNAFESGSLFSNELITDDSKLKFQATADFWRREFYPLSKSATKVIRGYFNAPQALLSHINSYLSGPLINIVTKDLPADIELLIQQNIEEIDKVKQAWLAADDLEALISNSGVDKRSYSSRYLPSWVDEVTQWSASSSDDYKLADKLDKFSANTLAEKTKKGKAPSHPVFDQIDQLLAMGLDIKDRLIAHAIKEVRNIYAKEKQRFSLLSFDDLLSKLAEAVAADKSGVLKQRIRELYPVAMIDEFQDTDQQQYRIFSQIYSNEPANGLFMIGDPKQAIYAFRGADIFTYISARTAVTDHYNLGTNWRSTLDMVQATNRIFASAATPFIYNQHIPFLPVAAALDKDKYEWRLNGNKQPAVRIWCEDGTTASSDYSATMAKATAVNIRDILTLAQQGEATLVKGDKSRAIQPNDIAVLVRTGRQAAMIKQELAKCGIASVYLSNRSSVFSSTVANELARILQAALNPDSDRRLRSALACSLLGLSSRQIDKLNNDEHLWEQAVFEFTEYQQIWAEKGVLPMLRQLIFKRQIAQRLLAVEEGERALTDLMHLGELLQKASTELDSQYALLRWLNENIQTPNGDSGEQQSRLESERELVQIVTVHKSKGLEYNLVYLPFVSSFRETDTMLYHDENNQVQLELKVSDQAKEKAEKERLAEDLRLLYVALTRAVFGCVLGVGQLKPSKGKWSKSAIDYLLLGLDEDNTEGRTLFSALSDLCDQQDYMSLSSPPEITEGKYHLFTAQSKPLVAKVFSGRIRRDWRLTSYSALVKQGHKLEPNLVADSIKNDEDDVVELAPKPPVDTLAAEPFSSIFQFPKGARPGTFIHALFEHVAFDANMQGEEVTKLLAHQLQTENYPAEWLAVLQKMLSDVVSTPLNAQGMTLNQIDAANRLNELDFTMSIAGLSAYSFNQIIRAHDPLSARAPELDFYTVSGMLRGAIDLVFCFDGKYYVLDWKSNYLGDSHADYSQAALENAMIDHRYDFQYLVYTLALHRFLRTRIPDYCYDKHMGGLFYLFVRGMQANSDNGIFYTKPSRQLIEQLDELFAGALPYVS